MKEQKHRPFLMIINTNELMKGLFKHVFAGESLTTAQNSKMYLIIS